MLNRFRFDSDHNDITFYFFIILANILLILVNILKMVKYNFYTTIKQNGGHHNVDKTCQIKGFLIKNGEWFSIIDVRWLPNLCGAGGEASFAPSGKSSCWLKYLPHKKCLINPCQFNCESSKLKIYCETIFSKVDESSTLN